MHCATHNLKAHRNALFNSSDSPKSVRHFCSKEGVRFTWNSCIEECYLRDCCNQFPATNLDDNSVYPNCWNKMLVGLALRPFSEKTLAEQFCHLASLLQCKDDILFTGRVDENKDMSVMHRKRLKILKEALAFEEDSQSTGLDEVRRKLAGLEYCVFVACVFNEWFMNKTQNITLGKIDVLEAEMKECLTYFSEWKIATKATKKKHKDWEKFCILPQTYNNL